MNRCSPGDARTSIDLANQLMHAGIRFVPIPVFDDDDFNKQMADLDNRLSVMEAMCNDNT